MIVFFWQQVEILRLLARLAKEKAHAVTPRMLSTFLKLRLSSSVIHAETGTNKVRYS
jgi:hypothetical protein